MFSRGWCGKALPRGEPALYGVPGRWVLLTRISHRAPRAVGAKPPRAIQLYVEESARFERERSYTPVLAHCGLALATAYSQPKLLLPRHEAVGGAQVHQIDRNSGEKCGLRGCMPGRAYVCMRVMVRLLMKQSAVVCSDGRPGTRRQPRFRDGTSPKVSWSCSARAASQFVSRPLR